MFYVMVKAGAINTVKRRIYGFRSEGVDIGYPKQVWERFTSQELAALGAYKVDETAPPAYDTSTQRVVEGMDLINDVPVHTWTVEPLSGVKIKQNRIRGTKNEAIRRTSLEVPAINNMEMVDFMVAIWPMLDTASATPEILAVKDTYQYGKGRLNWLRNTATPAEILAYDPATDTNWPS